MKSETDPNDTCEPDDVLTCGQNGACDGEGACALYPDGTPCDEGRICLGEGLRRRTTPAQRP